VRGSHILQESRTRFGRSACYFGNARKQVKYRVNIVNGVLETSGTGLGKFESTFLCDPCSCGPHLIEFEHLENGKRHNQDQYNGQQPHTKAG
jgi:hypothetical protein